MHYFVLSRGTPCAMACVADRRGRRQAPSCLQINADDCERARKELLAFVDSILIKDIVKDTLWITVL